MYLVLACSWSRGRRSPFWMNTSVTILSWKIPLASSMHISISFTLSEGIPNATPRVHFLHFWLDAKLHFAVFVLVHYTMTIMLKCNYELFQTLNKLFGTLAVLIQCDKQPHVVQRLSLMNVTRSNAASV